jgi:DNA-binding CsgD family transcriptional regulator
LRVLGTNDWLVMNHLIYQIHSMEDLSQMRSMLVEQMKILFDYDSADFWLASPDGDNSLVNPVFYNENSKVGETYMEKLYSLDYGKGLLLSGKNMIYRETDIISEEERVKTDFYKQYFEPAGWHYGLNLIIAYQQRFLGVMSFYRKKGKENFTYEDVFVLEMLKDHLDYRLSKSLTKDDGKNKVTFEECVKKYNLTRREETILGFLLDGEPNEFICSVLCITNNTLKKHILNLYRKMEINNRMQLFKIVRIDT